jgi:hypothetical protein
MGIQLSRENASKGEIQVYFGVGVSVDNQVTFASHIDSHLREKSEKVRRRRHYVCPACGAPMGNSAALAERVLPQGEQASTVCDRRDQRFSLWDGLEKKFASEDVRRRVAALQEADRVKLDARRKGKLLGLEVQARIASANQKSWEIPQEEDDDGIDLMVEFTDESGNGIGKGLCLQLKDGNSHLKRGGMGGKRFG